MAIFQDVHKNDAEAAYRRMKSYLAPKDGFVHIVMINSFSKVANENFGCDTKYTAEIDTIISMMQKDGYEILDVKMNSVQNQGMLGQREGFHTIITYRGSDKQKEQKVDAPKATSDNDPNAPKIVKVLSTHTNTVRAANADKDWVCKACGATNRAGRRSCVQCGAPK